MSLAELQRSFTAMLIDAPGGIETRLDASATEGLAIYHNAYRAQLVSCLSDTCEKTFAWLGEEAFDAAARKHIVLSPPTSWTLGHYGDDFPATLAMLYPEDPEVPELARLDLTLRRAFDGPDAPPLDAARLTDVDWDSAVLRFVPTLTTIRITSNCVAIWSAIAEERTPPPVEMLPAPGTVLVWRNGFSPQFRTIEAEEAAVLGRAIAGAAFADLCTLLIDDLGRRTGEALAAKILGSWISTGLLSGVTPH